MAVERTGDGFADNLGRIYGIFAIGFLAFVILLAILEQVGIPSEWIGYLFLIFSFVIYGGFGLLARTMQVSDYYVVSRRVPAFYNGMAVAASWIGTSGYIALAGALYVTGYDALSYILGMTGGFVLLAVLIAPFLRKFGAYTVPDFLGYRFGGQVMRFVSVAIVIACSFLLLAAQMRGAGLVLQQFLGSNYEMGVIFGLVFVVLGTLLGGMRAVTWGQVAQYIVLVMAFIIPMIIISTIETGIPLPHLMYGQIMQTTSALELDMVQNGLAAADNVAHFNEPFSQTSEINFFAVAISLMLGTASMPFLLMRTLTATRIHEARRTNGWALIFVMLVFFTAPIYAVFVRYDIYKSVIGQALNDLPDWVFSWGAGGGIDICGTAATSIEAISASCAAAGTEIVRLTDFQLSPDILVLAASDIANLPFVVTALVGAGALAAALAAANGLMVAISGTLSQDIVHRMIDRKAPTARRLVVARAIALATAFLAAFGAMTLPPDILKMIGWSFSLAASGLFPALVLGIWWKRCNGIGAIAGMLAGFGIAGLYIFGLHNYGWSWFGLAGSAAAVFGVPLGFAVSVGVSLLTPEPSEDVQSLVADMRVPRGRTYMEADRERRRSAELQR
jgi:cation/acetate symporter